MVLNNGTSITVREFTGTRRYFDVVEGRYYAISTAYAGTVFPGCTILATFGSADFFLLANTTGTVDTGGNNLYTEMLEITVE